MSAQPSLRNLKLDAAARRLDAVGQAALRGLSVVRDLRAALAGEAEWTPAQVDTGPSGRIDHVPRAGGSN